MKTVNFLSLILSSLLLCSCLTQPSPPAKINQGAVERPTQQAQDAASAQAKADEKQAQRDSQAAASFQTIKTVNEGQPPGPKTDTIRDEAEIGLASLGAKPDPVALLDGERRAKLREEGKATEARKSADEALSRANKLSQDYAIAQREAQEARTALSEGLAKAKQEIDAQNEKHAKETLRQNGEIAELKRKLEEKELSFITYIIGGIGGICLLGAIGLAIAAFHSVAGWSLRTIWTVALLILSAVLCFGLVRFLSHPWWPHVIGGGLALLLCAAAVMQFMSWRENKAKLLAQQNEALGTQKEYSELEQTAAFIVDELERAAKKAPDAMEPIFEELKGRMDGLHKDWVAYLKTLRPSKTNTPNN